MFAFFLQSSISLSLAGVLVFATLTSDFLKGKRQTQKILIGLCFGVTVISLSMTSVEVGPLKTVMNAMSGPLLFAGYLGGPFGVVFSGLCAVLYRVSIGAPMPLIAIYMVFAIPLIGLGVSYLRSARNWPEVPGRALMTMLMGYGLVFLPPFANMTYFSPTPLPLSTALTVIFIFAVTGTVSILVTWKILNFATGLADRVNNAAELAANLDLAMRVSGMGMFKQENDGAILFDAGMAAIYGLNPSSLSKTGPESGFVKVDDWRTFIHPEDLPRIEAEAKRVRDGTQQVGRSEFRGLRPDGTLRYIRSAWVADASSTGASIRVTGMHTDFTDKVEAEQQHKTSQERLAMIVEKLPGVILELDLTDPNGVELLYVSPKCHEIWGVEDHELYENPHLLAQMHDPEDFETFAKMMTQWGDTGKPFFHRFKITARGGETRWLDFHGSASAENDSRKLVKAVVLDVTREVEAQGQMQQQREIARRAQKFESIGQLTGGVAHDFNNLLAVILGNLELLRDDEEPGKQKALIDTAISASLRGADLTKNMLAFARKAPLTPVKLDLNDVVREAKNWIGRTLPESVTVETSLLAGLWAIDADRASLESALLNLTLNARDAMEGRGNLTIETANVRIDEEYIDARHEELSPGRYVMLAVSDTGPGMDKDTLASIFEPFFTTKPPGVGSGLGLSMTLGFMRQSGGTVQVYSEVGEGTTFKLYFPAAEAQPRQPVVAPATDATGEGAGRRLLLAEDEQEVRETLVTILERAGYQVTATASGDDAFATFAADPRFDLLLTDIVMPGKLQGTNLAKELRLQWPHLPVIFMSGYASEATVHGNGLRPEDIRLMKPVQRADLLAALRKAATHIKGAEA